jgi:hypothetical protein
VARFFLGFSVASALWGAGLAALHFGLGWGPPPLEEAPVEVAVVEDEPAPEDDAPTGRRRRRRSGSGAGAGSGEVPTGDATIGDDLREGEMRTIDGEGTGGEAQLSGSQIEGAFDGAMGRIRRCFILAPGDEPVTGTLTFGLRIAGSGRVSAVNLSGPRALTAGEPGDCLRDAARGISFPSFDGPEMLVRYPITLE